MEGQIRKCQTSSLILIKLANIVLLKMTGNLYSFTASKKVSKTAFNLNGLKVFLDAI